MTSRSSRGRWQRAVDARRQAREALGRDRNQGDLFDERAKKKTTLPVFSPPLIVDREQVDFAVNTVDDVISILET